MTCVVVALAGGRAHLFADTAHLGPFGGLVFSASKVRTFPKGQFAMAVRGAAMHSLALSLFASRCISYAAARKRLPAALRGPLGRLLSLSGPFEVYVAGIAASGAPEAFMVVSHRKHVGVEPWALVDIPYSVTTGPAPEVDPEDDPVAFGVRAAEMQRGVLQRLPFARQPVAIVGGQLEHIEIGPTGLRRQVLGGWFDRVGEKLNPMAGFSRAGAKVRKAPLMSFTDWLFPRTLSAWLRFTGMIFAAYIVATLAFLAPTLIYVEWTYHGAPQTTVSTVAGSWDAYTRLDLGKLITTPTLGRESANAALHRRSKRADHVEAARLVLAEARANCEIVASREVLLDEYEYELRCN